MDYAQTLLQDGVVVIPAFNNNDTKLYNTAFWQTVRSFPEYLNPSDPSTIYVQGAFGALSNPASFHNIVVRHIRMNIMFNAVPLFSNFNKLTGQSFNLEQLIDRMSIRRKGTSLAKETWHRDQAAILPGDIIFGGWVNLDLNNEQRFSCIPGSHIVRTDASGFIRETPVDSTKKKIYTVPPGHWIVFFQNILHEVLPGKVKFDSIRLFTGWRLTNSSEPLYNQQNALLNQGIPYIPSGQLPTMYSPNHLTFHSEMLFEWSQRTFKPQCLELKVSAKLGEYIVVHKIMQSLKQYNLPMYSEYTNQELSILRPSREWILSGHKINI